MFRKLVAVVAILASASAAHAQRYFVDAELSIQVTANSVSIEASPTGKPKLQAISDPPRFIFDLPGVKGRKSPAFALASHQIFQSIRVGRHPDFSRVVIDLRAPLDIEPAVAIDKKSITATFPTKATSKSASLKSKATVAQPLTPVDVEQDMPASPFAQELGLKFSLNRMVVTFPFAGRPVADVTVKNQSKRPIFMTATVEEVVDPGTPQQSRRSTVELLASPRRFEIKPGEDRAVRLLLAQAPRKETESVYRVNFIPDADPFDPTKDPSKVATRTGIAMLVLTEPKDSAPELRWDWTENGVTLENAGNANVLLDRGSICSRETCMGLPAQRLYPGNKWVLEGDEIDSVQFLQKSGELFEQIVIRRGQG